PLGVILGFGQGIERRLGESDALRAPVASIVRETLRCRNLVQELLTFSRRSTATERVDLNDAVLSSALMLESRARLQGVEVRQGHRAGVEPGARDRSAVRRQRRGEEQARRGHGDVGDATGGRESHGFGVMSFSSPNTPWVSSFGPAVKYRSWLSKPPAPPTN